MLDGRGNLGLRRRLRLGDGYAAVGRHILAKAATDGYRDIRVQRAGMGFFLVKAEFWKSLQDCTRFDFQLARQLVYSDFAHTVESAARDSSLGARLNEKTLLLQRNN
jgi:hypothetical protein